MMLGQVEPKHFRRLARPCVRLGKTQALVSWSGTMFEYLMPELFMRSRPGTLLNESARAVVRLQRQLGEARLRPWGVSESGYHAFDMHLNYQYRAFGLREVALGGGTRQSVVAPYASLLALCICPARWRTTCWPYAKRAGREHTAFSRPPIIPARIRAKGRSWSEAIWPTIRAWRWRLWPTRWRATPFRAALRASPRPAPSRFCWRKSPPPA